jgi:hypothetical protein
VCGKTAASGGRGSAGLDSEDASERQRGGDAIGEPSRGVRGTGLHIEPRELVPLTALMLLLIGVLCAVQGDR